MSLKRNIFKQQSPCSLIRNSFKLTIDGEEKK